jgi:hypothetical protein
MRIGVPSFLCRKITEFPEARDVSNKMKNAVL